MARKTVNYSQYLASICALIGIPTSRLTTEEAASVGSMFDSAMRKIWGAGPWFDISPNGEARFLGNRLTYPNDLTKASYWTATAVTLTANAVQNPADGLITASKMMETAATSFHKVVQNVATFFPSTEYTLSCYARPNGRNFVEIKAYDGDAPKVAMFNILTGAVVSSTFASATIGQQPNGFWLCKCTFTASASATTSGTYTVSLSSDGTMLTYAGDTTKGAYIWGNLIQQTSNTPLNDSMLPWDQTGENTIDTLFDAFAQSPFATNAPIRLNYDFKPQGIQFINATPYQYAYYSNGIAQSSIYGTVPANPIFIFYRKTIPSWTGTVFDATDTYAVDEQIYFVDSLGAGNYYKCIVATTAGQDPEDTPTSWELIPIPDVFFQFLLFQSYADWLTSDGQADKAMAFYNVAKMRWDDAWEIQERQMGSVMPTKYQTHLSVTMSG